MRLIERDFYLNKLKDVMGTPDIKVITGVRRSGKSKLLESFMAYVWENEPEVNIIHVNFNLNAYENLTEYHVLHDYIENAYLPDKNNFVFIDEVQMCSGFEKAINSLHASEKYDIYITGSNARLLSGELATYIGGRYVEFVIYPFSFAEFIELYRTIFPNADIRQCFSKYLRAGGMPYLSNLRYDETASRQYLRDLFNSVELKDIVKRNNIRDVDMLERIIAYLKSEGRSVSPETVLSYIKACTDAFLFYQVKRQDLQGKKILTVNEKYYVADHGIREAVFGGNMKEINLVMENIVYMELLRRGYTVTVGKTGNKEIDFVCEDQGNKLYIQVAYLLASTDTIEREFGVYDRVRDNFPKYVITLDEFDMSRNGIKHCNIRDFLLQEEWN